MAVDDESINGDLLNTLLAVQFHNQHIKKQHVSKHTEPEQWEKSIVYLQATKTHTSSIQEQEETERHTSVEETHLYKTTTFG